MDSKTLPPHTIELVQRHLNSTPAQQKILRLLVLAGLILFALTITAAYFFFNPILPKNINWSEIWQKMTSQPASFFAQLAAITLILLALSWKKKERLILDEQGIRYISSLPRWLQFLKKSWQVDWSMIQKITLVPNAFSPRADMSTLRIETGQNIYKLLPGHWVIRGLATNAAERGSIWRNLNPRLHEIKLSDTPVIRYLKAREINIKSDGPLSHGGHLFAIEKNLHTLLATLLFFVMGAYAFVGTVFVYEESYAVQPPYAIFLGSGVLFALAVLLWLTRAGVPILESVVLAMLLGTSIGGAMYPGLLRINELSDEIGLVEYQYVLQENMQLTPRIAILPTLRFDNFHEYWQHHGAGSLHYFKIRKGGLDFYQINMRPLYDEIKIFYKK